MSTIESANPTVQANGLWAFAKVYVRSMRLYYSFITGVAGWIGVSFVGFLYPREFSDVRACAVLAVLFLSWGVNQIINDYLGRAEDRINAPNRPRVTGELNPRWALATSGTIITAGGVLTWCLSPWALIPYFGGILLNVVYEYAKGVPLLGNLTFGVMIAMCTAYGYLAMTPTMDDVFTTSRISVLGLVVLMNGLLTYYTYFKDHDGDKAAGKRTLVVIQGLSKSRFTAIACVFLPTIAIVSLKGAGLIEAPFNQVFVFLLVVTFLLQLWTGILYYCHPTGKRAYYSLVTNFRAYACAQVTLIALFNKILALYLFIIVYVFIGFLFGLHKDHEA